MATKRQHKRGNVRKMRRILKRTSTCVLRLGMSVQKMHYGGGLSGRRCFGSRQDSGED